MSIEKTLNISQQDELIWNEVERLTSFLFRRADPANSKIKRHFRHKHPFLQ